MSVTAIPAGEQRLAIGRAAEICGTTPSTLRSWERRYGFPAPPRRDSGHRVYTPHELDLVREVVARTHDGAPVSLAIEDVRRSSEPAEPLRATQPGDFAERLAGAAERLDQAGVREVFRQAWESLDWDALVSEVIVPAMRAIGDRWRAGRLSVAAEHMATSIVRTQVHALGRFLGDARDGPLAVCACAPDEQHDLGLLLQSVELRRRGWRVLFLGAAVPVEDLAPAVASVAPQAVFTSATTAESVRALRRLPESLHAHGVDHVRVIAGGCAPDLAAQFAGTPLEVVDGSVLRTRLEALEGEWRSKLLTAAR